MPMRRPKLRCDLIEVVHRPHIAPADRNRKDQIRMAKAHLCQRLHLLFPQRQLLRHQIRARHTQMNAPS